MDIELFLDRDGKISGPHSPDELKQMARAGGVAESDLIRKGMHGKPSRAGDFKGLFVKSNSDVATRPNEPSPEESESEKNVPLARDLDEGVVWIA